METQSMEEMEQEYQQTIETRHKLHLAVNISKQLLQNGRYDDSRDYALQGLSTLAERMESQEGYELNSIIGVGYMHQNNYEPAKYYLTKADKIAEATQNTHQLALSYNNLACLAYSISDNETALEYYKRSEQISVINGYTHNLISTFLNILRIYKDIKKYDQAKEYFNKIVASAPSDHFLAQAHSAIGGLYFDIGNLKLAYYYNNLALKYYQDNQEPYFTAGCLLQLADICQARKQYDKALEYANQAFSLCTECNFKTYLITAILCYGIIYLRKKDYPKALEYFQQLAECEDTIDETNNLPDFYKNFSEYYEEVGDSVSAQRYRQKLEGIRN